MEWTCLCNWDIFEEFFTTVRAGEGQRSFLTDCYAAELPINSPSVESAQWILSLKHQRHHFCPRSTCSTNPKRVKCKQLSGVPLLLNENHVLFIIPKYTCNYNMAEQRKGNRFVEWTFLCNWDIFEEFGQRSFLTKTKDITLLYSHMQRPSTMYADGRTFTAPQLGL